MSIVKNVVSGIMEKLGHELTATPHGSDYGLYFDKDDNVICDISGVLHEEISLTEFMTKKYQSDDPENYPDGYMYIADEYGNKELYCPDFNEFTKVQEGDEVEDSDDGEVHEDSGYIWRDPVIILESSYVYVAI